MPRWIFGILLVPLLASSQGRPQPACDSEFCAGFRKIFAARKTEFKELRGALEHEDEEGRSWSGTITLPGFPKCAVEEDMGPLRYECSSQRSYPNDEADRIYRRTVQEIRSVVPSAWVVREDKGTYKIRSFIGPTAEMGAEVITIRQWSNKSFSQRALDLTVYAGKD